MFYNPQSMICDWEDNVLKIKPFCDVLDLAELTTQIAPECPPGMVKDECAIECDRLCAYYLFVIREKGLCFEGTKCESGCVAAEKKAKCPKGHLWLNENTCVTKHDCMCLSDNDKPVKPGQVVREGMCKECQCIDNFYSCNEENCKEEFRLETKVVTQKNVDFETPPPTSTTPGFLIPSVTPPVECTEDR